MTQAQNDQERRRHNRLPVRTYAQLTYGDRQWEAHLLDMSYSGARLALLDEHPLKPGDNISLLVMVDKQPENPLGQIKLAGKLVHLREHLLGVAYEPVDAENDALLKAYLAQQQ
jgi:hypothetical protein